MMSILRRSVSSSIIISPKSNKLAPVTRFVSSSSGISVQYNDRPGNPRDSFPRDYCNTPLDAIDSFNTLLSRRVSSISDYNFVLSSLATMGSYIAVICLFKQLEKSPLFNHRVVPNNDTWNILIQCHCRQGSWTYLLQYTGCWLEWIYGKYESCKLVEIQGCSSDNLNEVQINIKINLEDESPNPEVLAPETFEPLKDKSAVSDDIAGVANGNSVGLSEPCLDKVLPGSSCVLIKGDSSVVDKDNSMEEDISAGSTGGISCRKDVDQPSPISVLDPSFTDDMSSCSECFGSVSPDLQACYVLDGDKVTSICMVVTLESVEHVEGSMVISSDEDGVEISSGMLEGNALWRTENSWVSSYIIDVLSESAFWKFGIL